MSRVIFHFLAYDNFKKVPWANFIRLGRIFNLINRFLTFFSHTDLHYLAENGLPTLPDVDQRDIQNNLSHSDQNW